LRRKYQRLNKHSRLQRRRTRKLHQSKEKILRMKLPKKKTRKVMIRSMRLKNLHLKRLLLMPSREETRKLTMNSTKLRKRTSQLPLKLTHLPRPSPLSKKSQKLLIRKLSKKPLTPPKKRLNFKKSRNKNIDSRKSEKERDAQDSSHQFSAHSKSNKN